MRETRDNLASGPSQELEEPRPLSGRRGMASPCSPHTPPALPVTPAHDACEAASIKGRLPGWCEL